MKHFPLRPPGPLLLLLLLVAPWAPQPAGQDETKQDEKGGGIPTPEEVQKKLETDAAARIRAERTAHFRICDSNRNGWISFREARYALLMDREEFRQYDADGDGRIDPQEFETRYAKVLAQVGGLPVLRAELQKLLVEGEAPELTPLEPEATRTSFPTPADLLLAYDRNRDDALSRRELAAMFQALAVDLPVEMVLGQLDTNRTALLEMDELAFLADNIARRMSPPEETPKEIDDAEIFRRLYSSSRPRLLPEGSTPRPPLIPGPVSHFRRLDLDDNGFIDDEDLHTLLTPARVGVRPDAVLAALDRDGDGRLDETEFRACLGAPARRR